MIWVTGQHVEVWMLTILRSMLIVRYVEEGWWGGERRREEREGGGEGRATKGDGTRRLIH